MNAGLRHIWSSVWFMAARFLERVSMNGGTPNRKQEIGTGFFFTDTHSWSQSDKLYNLQLCWVTSLKVHLNFTRFSCYWLCYVPVKCVLVSDMLWCNLISCCFFVFVFFYRKVIKCIPDMTTAEKTNLNIIPPQSSNKHSNFYLCPVLLIKATSVFVLSHCKSWAASMLKQVWNTPRACIDGGGWTQLWCGPSVCYLVQSPQSWLLNSKTVREWVSLGAAI